MSIFLHTHEPFFVSCGIAGRNSLTIHFRFPLGQPIWSLIYEGSYSFIFLARTLAQISSSSGRPQLTNPIYWTEKPSGGSRAARPQAETCTPNLFMHLPKRKITFLKKVCNAMLRRPNLTHHGNRLAWQPGKCQKGPHTIWFLLTHKSVDTREKIFKKIQLGEILSTGFCETSS
jgi:hypothetical protein